MNDHKIDLRMELVPIERFEDTYEVAGKFCQTISLTPSIFIQRSSITRNWCVFKGPIDRLKHRLALSYETRRLAALAAMRQYVADLYGFILEASEVDWDEIRESK